jgi:hypothetical protein
MKVVIFHSVMANMELDTELGTPFPCSGVTSQGDFALEVGIRLLFIAV